MSARKGMNLKRVKNQLELLEGILEQDATSRCKNISSRYALRIAQACVNKQIGQKPRKNGLYSAHSGIFRKIPAYTCPSCGNMCLEKWATERSITSYCWDCGQKLDWEDAENNGN